MNFRVYEVASALAQEYGVPAAHVAAIIEVESAGVYDPCSIRFEGHYLYRLLSGAARDRAVAVGLAHPKAGRVKNPRSMSARYKMLDRAIAIDRDAAIESTSWGVGQVMGAHWQRLGFASADALRREALSGLEGQARLMMRYVRVFGLLDELSTGAWSPFARGYNGPGYRANRYDEKMAAAARRYGGQVASADGMLRMGAKGARVRELQGLLARAGYAVRVDGDFGPTTRSAVRAFQRSRNLSVDGVAGPETLRSLSALKVSPEENVGKASLTDIPHVEPVAGAIGGAATIGGLKDSIEAAAGQIGALAGYSSVFETAASGLVAVAGLIGVAAAGYAAWQWIRSNRTFEGVSA
ncbi:Putative peptidoglycan binding domain-containing protein [Fulvimarina manganoxydans]|uniref:Putative peptidoglycan binding domain-containing protein n=1 Tax=Fulvimarina manganoxydans TaxID=937218 RepID=A0A1W1Y9J6_9HYPH|nr:N-acetylmuramidase domain-containing protein [Fulvimarina manganoxydans]SMC32418.1 Putative peptidoglycan binding domain-containing protein [Fulvimarina manganoxydans]